MKSSDFYTALGNLPKSYRFSVTDNVISGIERHGMILNPITAVAYRTVGEAYGTNKRETTRAGKDLGLDKEYVDHVYNATKGTSNRGNAQVVRGKIRSALGV